jgi:ADP-heptose:LPS heptosyltransferase
MSLATLRPILSRHDVQCVVLQQGAPRAELEQLDAATRVRCIDAASACGDMGETAHVMARCDVILSVDTAVVHVAGALGLPTWVMVAHPAEWRWGRQRSDSPFYPSVRVIRQHQGGDWNSVVQDVNRAIDQWLAARLA